MSYVQGEVVQLQATVTNASGTAVDPGAVQFSIRQPSGTTSTPTATHSGTGIYTVQVDTTPASGTWLYKFVGTGSNQCAGDGLFEVDPIAF